MPFSCDEYGDHGQFKQNVMPWDGITIDDPEKRAFTIIGQLTGQPLVTAETLC